jgi:hypothetical protein
MATPMVMQVPNLQSPNKLLSRHIIITLMLLLEVIFGQVKQAFKGHQLTLLKRRHKTIHHNNSLVMLLLMHTQCMALEVDKQHNLVISVP